MVGRRPAVVRMVLRTTGRATNAAPSRRYPTRYGRSSSVESQDVPESFARGFRRLPRSRMRHRLQVTFTQWGAQPRSPVQIPQARPRFHRKRVGLGIRDLLGLVPARVSRPSVELLSSQLSNRLGVNAPPRSGAGSELLRSWVGQLEAPEHTSAQQRAYVLGRAVQQLSYARRAQHGAETAQSLRVVPHQDTLRAT